MTQKSPLFSRVAFYTKNRRFSQIRVGVVFGVLRSGLAKMKWRRHRSQVTPNRSGVQPDLRTLPRFPANLLLPSPTFQSNRPCLPLSSSSPFPTLSPSSPNNYPANVRRARPEAVAPGVQPDGPTPATSLCARRRAANPHTRAARHQAAAASDAVFCAAPCKGRFETGQGEPGGPCVDACPNAACGRSGTSAAPSADNALSCDSRPCACKEQQGQGARSQVSWNWRPDGWRGKF